MSEKKTAPAKKSFSPDWLVRGILTKIGDTFDRLTGRNWKPSNSLATSELIERLKILLDSEAKDSGAGARFVPHNIKLKMQWNKFSTDAEDAIKKLENELLAAAVDHINDHRYHTYAPLKVEAKPDYFTEGVQLWASFDEFAPGEQEEGVIKVTLPNMSLQNIVINEPAPVEPEPEVETFAAEFVSNGKPKSVALQFTPNKRRSVGRTKENDLTIDDASVSKVHASLVLNGENRLLVADTGSTNGTFVNGERIAYGRAFPIAEGARVKFGTVEVFFRRVPKPADFEAADADDDMTYTTTEMAALGADSIPAGKENAVADEFLRTQPVFPADGDGLEDFGDAGNGAKYETVSAANDYEGAENKAPKTQPRVDFDE